MTVSVCTCVQLVSGQPRASPPTPWGPTKLPGTRLKAFPGCQSYSFPQGLPSRGEMEQLGVCVSFPGYTPTAWVGIQWAEVQLPGC